MFIGSMPVWDLAHPKQAPSSSDCWAGVWFFAGKANRPRLDDRDELAGAVAAAGAAAAGTGAAGAGCWAYPAGMRSAPRSKASGELRRCDGWNMALPPQWRRYLGSFLATPA